MNSEKRVHQRIEPTHLAAQISITHPSTPPIITEGTVLDISYSGIKIKLSQPLTVEKNDKITINLNLPKSGIPIAIHGIVKHCLSKSECGIYFGDLHPEESVDDLLFECVMTNH